jgi:hypothetical protein
LDKENFQNESEFKDDNTHIFSFKDKKSFFSGFLPQKTHILTGKNALKWAPVCLDVFKKRSGVGKVHRKKYFYNNT